MKGQATRSPAEMFVVGMVEHGIRGETLDELTEGELEVFGVDWEAMREEAVWSSQNRQLQPLGRHIVMARSRGAAS